MDIQNLLIISITAIFINNYVFSRFLGICPYLGVSKQLDSAVGMGFAVVFVMGIASAVTWIIYFYFLAPTSHNVFFLLFEKSGQKPPDLTYLQTISFIFVIAALVQFVEMVIQKMSPGLYRALGIYLPLITTNCAVLGVSFLNIDSKYNFLESVVNGIASGLGFMLALILMAGLREKQETARIPNAMKGAPIAFIMAGLMSLAFMGFSGLSIGK
jgi:electron transport complex protein RnfA